MTLTIAIAAVLLAALVIADFFIPMLPSATTIATLAGFLIGSPMLLIVLLAGSAFASWAGDVLGYRALRHARSRVQWPILASAKVTRLEGRLRESLRRHPHWTTIVARFLPAGRTALAWAAVDTPEYRHARLALMAGIAWAAYMVGLGLGLAALFGPGLLSAATTITSVVALSVVLGWWFRGSPAAAPAQK